MKPKYSMSLPTLVIAALIATGAPRSTADPAVQTEVKSAVEVVEAKQWRDLRVREVSSRIMAWWLDPVHNSTPIEYVFAERSLKLVSAPGATADAMLNKFRPEAARKLPAGVKYIFELPTHNALHVFSTEQGFHELEATVKLLDKRLAQVEIQGDFVEVTPQGAKALEGKRYMSTDESRALVKKLIAEKNAVTVSSPRVTAINNLTARLGRSVSIPAAINVKDAQNGFTVQVDAAPKTGADVFLTVDFSFVATPTINADNTITVLIQPTRTLLLTMGNNNQDRVTLQTLQGVTAVANLKEDQTFVLTGLDPQMTKVNIPGSKNNVIAGAGGKELVIFVTAYDIERWRQSLYKTLAASQPAPLGN